MTDFTDEYKQAARWIREADALFIGAGAGMGVDSGLPDFRGDEGFWKAYPPFRKRGLSFTDMANPRWFQTDPAQAWGFYGHRLNLYRKTKPHTGFQRLLGWGQAKKLGYFVFTSNVDGQFQRAGFDSALIEECHGSIHHLQCVADCVGDIWSAEGIDIEIDEKTFKATGELPHCKHCNRLARPNILMFGDSGWSHVRSYAQADNLDLFNEKIADHKVVSIECGAGKAIPTVRFACQNKIGRLIRINPREATVPPGQISLPLGASEALENIARFLKSLS